MSESKTRLQVLTEEYNALLKQRQEVLQQVRELQVSSPAPSDQFTVKSAQLTALGSELETLLALVNTNSPLAETAKARIAELEGEGGLIAQLDKEVAQLHEEAQLEQKNNKIRREIAIMKETNRPVAEAAPTADVRLRC